MSTPVLPLGSHALPRLDTAQGHLAVPPLPPSFPLRMGTAFRSFQGYSWDEAPRHLHPRVSLRLALNRFLQHGSFSDFCLPCQVLAALDSLWESELGAQEGITSGSARHRSVHRKGIGEGSWHRGSGRSPLRLRRVVGVSVEPTLHHNHHYSLHCFVHRRSLRNIQLISLELMVNSII